MRASSRRALLSLPIWVVFLFCAALPLLWIGWKILSNPGALVELSFDEFRIQLLLRTLLYNISAGLIATLLAVPAAIAIGRGRGSISAILWILLPLTLLMPSIAYTYGWSQFVRLNLELFQQLGVSFEAASPSDVVRCVWSLATWLWSHEMSDDSIG